jgi:hypothetical protein
MNRPGMSGDFIRWKEDEVMGRPSQYPREMKERGIRLVVESNHEYDSEFVAIVAISKTDARVPIGAPADERHSGPRRPWVLPSALLATRNRGWPTTRLVRSLRVEA